MIAVFILLSGLMLYFLLKPVKTPMQDSETFFGRLMHHSKLMLSAVFDHNHLMLVKSHRSNEDGIRDEAKL